MNGDTDVMRLVSWNVDGQDRSRSGLADFEARLRRSPASSPTSSPSQGIARRLSDASGETRSPTPSSRRKSAPPASLSAWRRPKVKAYSPDDPAAYRHRKEPLKLLSWNVNGRTGEGQVEQLAAVLDREPDIVALQEVTSRSHPLWLEGLLEAGFPCSAALICSPSPMRMLRFGAGTAIFSPQGTPFAQLPGLSFDDSEEAAVAFPEKYLAGSVSIERQVIDVHTAHLPPGSTRGVIKVHAFEAIRRRIDADRRHPRVLCGDFNTPREETDTNVITWAGTRSGAPARRWEAAERGILANDELPDVYRQLREAGSAFPASHYTRDISRRYDHVYASIELQALGCEYLSDSLGQGLSDHAPVEASFADFSKLPGAAG